MKNLFMTLLFVGTAFASMAQAKDSKQMEQPDKTKKLMTVEASCGQCQFDMEGSGCDLAVRIDGKSYYVDGTDLNSHGDAHEDDGFCNAIRKAKVQGEVVDDRFKASYFKLLPKEVKK